MARPEHDAVHNACGTCLTHGASLTCTSRANIKNDLNIATKCAALCRAPHSAAADGIRPYGQNGLTLHRIASDPKCKNI